MLWECSSQHLTDIRPQTFEINLIQTPVYRSKLDTIHLLLENGANVNLAGGKYGSALAAASYHDELDTIHLLLENGADVNLAGGKYGSALAAASYNGKAEIVRLLLENGADIHLAGGKYDGVLAAAAYGTEPEIVHILLENGADINLAGGDYGSALAAACASPGYLYSAPVIQTVRLLLVNGADLEAHGTRALEEASKRGYEDIVALLRRRLDGIVSDAEDRADDEETSSVSDLETSSPSDSE